MGTAMAVDVAATAALLVAMVAAHQRRAVPAAAATALEMGPLMAYWELMTATTTATWRESNVPVMTLSTAGW